MLTIYSIAEKFNRSTPTLALLWATHSQSEIISKLTLDKVHYLDTHGHHSDAFIKVLTQWDWDVWLF